MPTPHALPDLALVSALKFVRDYEFFRRALMGPEGSRPARKPRIGAGEFDPHLGSLSAAASSANKFIRQVVVR